jgi:hypothetical protein
VGASGVAELAVGLPLGTQAMSATSNRKGNSFWNFIYPPSDRAGLRMSALIHPIMAYSKRNASAIADRGGETAKGASEFGNEAMQMVRRLKPLQRNARSPPLRLRSGQALRWTYPRIQPAALAICAAKAHLHSNAPIKSLLIIHNLAEIEIYGAQIGKSS